MQSLLLYRAPVYTFYGSNQFHLLFKNISKCRQRPRCAVNPMMTGRSHKTDCGRSASLSRSSHDGPRLGSPLSQMPQLVALKTFRNLNPGGGASVVVAEGV